MPVPVVIRRILVIQHGADAGNGQRPVGADIPCQVVAAAAEGDRIRELEMKRRLEKRTIIIPNLNRIPLRLRSRVVYIFQTGAAGKRAASNAGHTARDRHTGQAAPVKGIVADGRNMDLKKVRKLSDGRIYTAKQAKENGLIDEIADTYDDAEAKLISDNQLYSCEIYDFRYEPEESLFGGLVSGTERKTGDNSSQGDLAALNDLLEKADTKSIPLEYMCPAVKK